MNPLSDPNFVILYVENPSASAAFYAALLGRPPVQSSPNFALFSLNGSVMLGLWARHDVQPAATGTGGGAEIGIAVGDNATVEARHAEWRARGIRILQAPVAMDFGFTFTAADPDGHRLRVFAPTAA